MFLSVIMPIFNAADNIDACINSILLQENVDFELICIDDGSTDDSMEILKSVVTKNKRVKVIANNHIGVAFSRNQGIQEAQGQYVCFMDADDLYPSKDVLATLCAIAKDTGEDIVGGSFSDFSDGKVCESYEGDLAGYTIKENGWIDYRDYQFDYGFHRFIYRKDFLISNNIYFPELVRFQDPPFMVKAMHTAGGFQATDKIVYKYRLSNSGIHWTDEKICDCISGIVMNMMFAKQEKYIKLYSYSASRLVRLLYDVLIQNEKISNYQIRARMNQIRFALPNDFDLYDISDDDLVKFKYLIDLYEIGKQPLITFVVPAYNVEKYIRKCLDSLIYQVEGACKLIIINDGSSDETDKICSSYLNNFPGQIKYHYQKNKGLGAARNKGLSMVDTPYVSFLDSDDWQDIRFVEKFEEFVRKLDFMPDMIFTLPKCYNERTRCLENWMDKTLYDELFFSEGIDIIKSLKADTNPELYLLEANANRKVYRTEFLLDNEFSFPEGVKWEDLRPHIQLLYLAKSVVALSTTGFIYRTNNSGQITSGRGVDRLDVIDVFKDMLVYVLNNNFNKNEQATVLNMICNYTLWMLEMTDIEYINALLDGLHEVFMYMPDEMVLSYIKNYNMDLVEKNKRIGLIECLRSNTYYPLADYAERKNLYRYWSLNGGKKKTIISGGIQCLKDSGIRYTVKLLLKKIFYQGL